MEKYRRWTDHATGINPFIQAKISSKTLPTLLLSSVVGLCKVGAFISLIIPICVALIIQSFISNKLINGILHVFPYSLMCFVLGLSFDDENYKNLISKSKNKGKLILSNSCNIADAFYYLSRLNAPRFIVSSPEQEKFTVLNGASLLFKVLLNKQPFFSTKNQGQSLQTILKNQLKKGNDCVLFYEGIKTNGLGTIKISRQLSKNLYQLEQQYILTHLNYKSEDNQIFSLTIHPLKLIWNCLRCFRINLKVRGREDIVSLMHSAGQLRDQVDSFLIANGSKLLQTNPMDYYEFYQFYLKNA